MQTKRKVSSGLTSNFGFSDAQCLKIIQDYMNSGKTKKEIWHQYTGNEQEHGNLLKLMRKFGYSGEFRTRRYIFTENNSTMPLKPTPVAQVEDSFEVLQLKKRILDLENQLKDAEMKAIAYSTMVDIAEKEFNIPIRKKVNTKPLKK